MAHQYGAQRVELEIVGAGQLGAQREDDFVSRADNRLVVRRVGRPAASLLCHLGDAEARVGDLRLGEEGDADVDNLVATLGGEVVERRVAQFPHGGVGLVEPVAEDAHDTPGRGGRGQREGEAALGRAGGVGLGHDAVGDGQVGDVCSQGAGDAHGGLHDHGAVVAGLEAVDAGEVGRDADAAAGVGADADGHDAGREGRCGSVGRASGIVGLVEVVDGRSLSDLWDIRSV